jgi:tetratricopeptide (TPR) repeat protein
MEDNWERGHNVMLETLHLVQRGEAEQAFKVLDSALEQATEEGHVTWVTILCRHAAIVAHAAGDRRREINYTEKALSYTKDYPFAIYNFAQLLLRDGQADLAKRYATKAYELSTTGATDANRDLTAALLKQWPEIAENR